MTICGHNVDTLRACKWSKRDLFQLQSTRTLPWPDPSPGEKGGGLGVRLATSPRKTSACYRNMYKNESSYLSSWERRTSAKKTDDALRWKPDDSGSYKVEHPSRKKSYQDGNLERKTYVWNGEDFPSCSRDEGLQPSTAWNPWDVMDSIWSKEVEFRWAAAVFRKRGCREPRIPKGWR